MERISDNRLAELIDQADNLHLPGTSYVPYLAALRDIIAHLRKHHPGCECLKIIDQPADDAGEG